MATIKLGGGVTGVRGSIGGTTFSHNAGGDYIRNRTKPVNPRSPLQNARRARLAHLAKYWSNDLTPQERTDWIAYAKSTTWTNRLGDQITINGLAAFIRLNTLFGLFAPGIHAAAPTAVGHAGGVTFDFDAQSDVTNIAMAEPTGAFVDGTAGQYLCLFQGFPTEIGRIATPKGFKYIGTLTGLAAPPITYPFDIPSAYTMTAGQFVTLRAMFIDEHYRVSGPFWAHATAAPSI